MIVAFLVWSAVAVTLAAIAVSCQKSDQPVGFFANVAPPSIRDVRAYNNAVSALWFISAAVFEIIGIPFLFLQQNSPIFVLVVLAVVIWCIALMIAYLKIEARYRK